MRSDRFDELTRLIARASDRKQSRRDLLRAVGTGGALAALGATDGSAAPDLKASIRARNQDAAVDPLIAETAFNLEYDVEKIFTFVRDAVVYDPYPGVLRGALGTLWGRAGNSADQALLLAALLSVSMVQTRFVTGALHAEAEGRLEVAMRLDQEAMRDWAMDVFGPTTTAGDIEPVALTTEAESLQVILTNAQERLQEAVERQLDEGIETVLGALAAAGVALPEPRLDLPDLERTQHVWVQFANGTEWVDLDPGIPNAKSGDTHAAQASLLDTLPEELFHRIALRLVSEKVAGGVIVREELLTFESTSAELVGVPITLMHPDADGLKAAGVVIQSVIGGYRNFIPSLIAGNHAVAGRPVTFVTGEGLLGTSGDDSIDGDTLGEWLEVDIRTPNGDRRVVREVFDRVGFARRSAGPFDPKAIDPVELIDTGGDSPGYPPLADVWSIGVVSCAVPNGYFRSILASEDPLIALSRSVHVYHNVRDSLALDNSGLRGQRCYYDEPNLTAIVQTRSTGMPDSQSQSLAMDLLHRHHAAVPVAGSNADVHPLVASGVFGHVIERALLETTGTELLGLPADGFLSVGRIFEEAKRHGIPIMALDPTSGDASSLAIDYAARLRVKAALADGYVVIAPGRAVTIAGTQRSGFWLVDPRTGTTLDQLDDGRGATLPEWARVTLFVICYSVGFYQLGLFSSMVGWLSGTRATAYQVGDYIENWVKLNLNCFFGLPIPSIPESEQ